MELDQTALKKSIERLQGILLDARTDEGYWEGYLSSSALATATAVFALSMVDRTRYELQIEGGLKWLAETVNGDGGWGDTPLSESNISTTMLCWSALTLAGDGPEYEAIVRNSEKWLTDQAGSLDSEQLIKTINGRYGNDRTFSTPILMMGELAGRIQIGRKQRQPLPFELAVLPHAFYKFLRLPIVSYALPVLIAIGQYHFHCAKPVNPVTRLLRQITRNRTSRKLVRIQPDSGGYLEAIPLTSFVMMSLVAAGNGDSVVVGKGVRFLLDSAREDGSWPIDTNLATWVTTLAINVLAVGGESQGVLSEADRVGLQAWLLDQHHRTIHPYTNAAPGGWAWNPATGAVPDADDTAGALIALYHLDRRENRAKEAAQMAVQWLLDIQNNDGGIPTFCKGWNKLPFDRSAADLTAHAMIAWHLWRDELGDDMCQRIKGAIRKALGYLGRTQRADGAWVPLWFGNQFEAHQQNPLYGTAKVLLALSHITDTEYEAPDEMVVRAVRWLLDAQDASGGWGAGRSTPVSIEETALAIDALASIVGLPVWCGQGGSECTMAIGEIQGAIARGTNWMMEHTRESFAAAPIGLYFARLWYYETLYPVIYALSALKKVSGLV